MHVIFVEPAFPSNQAQFVRALSDIGAVYSVKRRSWVGFLLGAAAGTALAWAVLGDWATESTGWLDITGSMAKGFVVTLGGLVVGGSAGWAIGRGTQGLDELQLEALPYCGPVFVEHESEARSPGGRSRAGAILARQVRGASLDP